MIYQLYTLFYKKPKYVEEERRIQENLKHLKKHISDYQKKLLLRIVDDQRLVCEYNSLNGFTQGFKLGCKLTTQIYNRDDPLTDLYDKIEKEKF